MFAVNRAARRFESLTAKVLAADGLGFLEGLVLAAVFFEAPRTDQAVATGGDVWDDAGECEPLRFVAGGEGAVATEDRSCGCAGVSADVEAAGEAVCAARDCGVRKLQKGFEEEIGKTALAEMLKAIRKLEARG